MRFVRPRRGWARKLAIGAALLLVIIGTLVAVVITPGPAAAQYGFQSIPSYQVIIRIEDSGDLLITETIEYDFGVVPRHGILRIIPVRLHYDDRYDRIYPLSDVIVTGTPGTPVQFEVEGTGATKTLRIGDPDRTITGVHRYAITYRVRGALNGFDDHDEPYWNAIGHEWPVAIARAEVTVVAPGEITEVACFSGADGSILGCDSAGPPDRPSGPAGPPGGGTTARFSHSDLSPYEGMTVVVGLVKGQVPEPAPILDERWSFQRAFAVTPTTAGAGTGLLILVVGGLTRMMWLKGRDRRFVGSPVEVAFGNDGGAEQRVGLLDRTLTPVQYEPPDSLRPGLVGTLVDEVAHPLDVTATIVDLAVRGYLRIEAVEKQGWFSKADWIMTKLDPPANDPLVPYEAKLLSGLFLAADSVKLSALRNTFATRLKGVQDLLYDDVVERGWFSSRPDSTRSAWTALGVLALLVAIGVTVLAAVFTHYALVALPLVVGGIVLLAGARRMPRRTAKGTGVLRRVEGFRRFIEDSEKERARFAERAHLFSEYLPYAIVFGCTEKWAKAFAGLDGELPETSWYRGNSAFTAGAFASSIDGFAVTSAGTIASTPSGSGSSGFSGGGSSGGGGGGGGGGSW